MPHSTPDLQVDRHSCGFQPFLQPGGVIVKDLFGPDLDEDGRKSMQVGEKWRDIGMGQRIPVCIGFDQPVVIGYRQERLSVGAGVDGFSREGQVGPGRKQEEGSGYFFMVIAQRKCGGEGQTPAG